MANAHRLVRNAWSNLLAAMPPALRVVSGDTIGTATLDAAGVNAAGRQPAGPPNPMNGPVYVEGAGTTPAGPAARLRPTLLIPRPCVTFRLVTESNG